MKKAILFLADGFEEIEAIGTVDFLRRSGVEVMTVSLKSKEVVGAMNVTVIADALMDKFNLDSADAVILPGGGQGTENLKNDQRVLNVVKDYFKRGKLVAAICAAPIVLDVAGILEGKNYTIYRAMRNQMKTGKYIEQMVVTDGNVITGSGPGATFAFAHSITAYLIDEKTANDTGLRMVLPQI